MEPITTQKELRAAILVLKFKQAEEGEALKEQFRMAYTSVNPKNIILNTIKDFGESNILKDGLLNTSVGLGTGYISKMIFQGVVNSPIKKLIGSALMFGITNIVARNPEGIKTMAKKVFNLFGSHSEEEVKEPENY